MYKYKKNRPLISIVTICRNNISGLTLTFDSVSNQSFQEIEWIVIDGASSDGTAEFLRELKYPVRYISEPDSGIYDAMNKGSFMIGGEYVVYMNSGDTFLNYETLDLVRNCITRNERRPDIILFGYKLKLPNGIFIVKKPRDFYGYIWHGMPTSHQAMFFSSEVIKKHPYSLSYKICGDYGLVAEMSKHCYFISSYEDPATVFEVGGSSFENPWLLMRESYAVKRDILKLDVPARLHSALKSFISIFGLRVLSFNLKNVFSFKSRND